MPAIQRKGAGLFAIAALSLVSASFLVAGAGAADAGRPEAKKRNDPEPRIRGDFLKATRLEEGRWTCRSRNCVVRSTISREYSAAAAQRLEAIRDCFVAIFKEPLKDKRPCEAYAFATESEYLKFSPESRETHGRFLRQGYGPTAKKNLAWFSIPAGETDFFKTDFTIVQHEAIHQLLDAYTDYDDIPYWFHEGCATFFESWTLDPKRRKEDMSSGLEGRYSLGICLSYPLSGKASEEPPPAGKRSSPGMGKKGPSAKGEQAPARKGGKPTPGKGSEVESGPADRKAPMADQWILIKDLLNRKVKRTGPLPPISIPIKPKEPLDYVEEFKRQFSLLQSYNESWCAITFLVNEKKSGERIFNQIVQAFRAGKQPDYDPKFVDDFDAGFRNFIEAQVLPHWVLPAVGGTKTLPGDSSPVPPDVKGFPLTADRRGDMFLVKAEKRDIAWTGGQGRIAMLMAWSVPTKFYEEAWKAAPDVLSQKAIPPVGDLYFVKSFLDVPGRSAIFLIPLWEKVPLQTEEFYRRLSEAAFVLWGESDP